MVRSFEELSNKNLNDYIALFIGGGNTFKLLKGLKDSNSFSKIKEYIDNDGIVFGGSTGAVIFGKDVKASEDNNDINLKDTIGFDVLNGYCFFPHYLNDKKKLTEEENIERHNRITNKLLDLSNELDILALPEEDSIIIDEDKMYFIGTKPYYEFKKNIQTKFEITDIKERL